MNSSDNNMISQASFIDIAAAQNLRELLSFEDESFIYCAYRTLLRRDPDETGLNYYLGRLRSGEKKMKILVDLNASAEARHVNARIEGFEAGINRYKLTSFYLFKKSFTIKNRNSVENIQALAGNKPPEDEPHKMVKIIRSSKINDFPISTAADNPERTIWVDLTTSFEWTQGVVGIIRAELEIACGLTRLGKNIRFSMQIENGFVEIKKDQLEWLLNAENVADAYMKFFGRYKNTAEENKKTKSFNAISVVIPDTHNLFFPFKPHDVVLSVGWMDSQKEVFFSKVKQKLKDIYIGYLIYDIILLLPQTRHFYHIQGQEKFKNYVKWISQNCDFIIYGGQTAKNDTEALQAKEGWPTPQGIPVKFGTDIVKSTDSDKDTAILKELGVNGPFIITVGSIEPRKNHDTLYKAYLLALEMNPTDLPQLVICGRPMWRANDIVDVIDRDPRLKGKVIRLSPTDTQLAALYRHCLFTVLPSLYEGWSLTLPESLGQGKFCLCADTPPLREIGHDFIDYAPAWDVRAWAEKICLYSKDIQRLKEFERRIAIEFPQNRWSDTAKTIYDAILKLSDGFPNSQTQIKTWHPKEIFEKPTIWMDITLSFLEWQGNVNGIIRAELNYARYLKKIAPETRFFAYTNEYFFEVEPEYLLWLFDETDLSSAYSMFQTYWRTHENAGTGYKDPFRVTGGPVVGHPAYLDEFPENSIVLFVGIDFIEGKEKSRIKDVVEMHGDRQGVLTSQLIYDFTPVLYPQFHVKETCTGYVPFVKHVSENFGHLLYGGRTAQRDGIALQNKEGWRIPPSDFIEFGSDFGKLNELSSTDRDAEILKKFDIEGDFIMTVGTIEPRKNHEMLYKAYVTLLERTDAEVIPKMLFIGKKGWKSEDFIATFEGDDRIRGKILMITPTDEELDVFYRHTLFTLLPSFYEGWSLTLPESLSYGKFCLTSDVDPLKETGRDLVEYINPLDTYAWADRIHHYSTHPAELAAKQDYIKKNWKPKTWFESAQMLSAALYSAHENRFQKK